MPLHQIHSIEKFFIKQKTETRDRGGGAAGQNCKEMNVVRPWAMDEAGREARRLRHDHAHPRLLAVQQVRDVVGLKA